MDIIYLHFLNREITRPFNINFSNAEVNQILSCVSTTTNCSLFSNYANLIEGGHFNNSFVQELLSVGIIKVQGERTSLLEYWNSRDTRYGFDSKRYPYKKEIENEKLNILPTSVRNFSMTSYIRENISKDVDNADDRFNINRGKEEKKAFWGLNERILEKEDFAVTLSLANSVLDETILSDREKLITGSNSGKYYSALYIDAICRSLNAKIITGINKVRFYDNIFDSLICNDYLLLKYFHDKINFTQKGSAFEVISWRGNENFLDITLLIKNLILSLSKAINSENVDDLIDVFRRCEKDSFNTVDRNNLEYHFSLTKLKTNLEKEISNFREIYVEIAKMKKPILIITATNSESEELLKIFSSNLGYESQIMYKGERAVHFLGTISNCEIFHSQCEAGSGGPSGSQAVITELVKNIKPSTVLMPGIAFGLIPKKQKIGDILISTHIREYEKARMGDNKIIPRGSKIPSSDSLLGLFRLLKLKWKETDLHFGILMSGEKLVDDENFVKYLLSIEPEAIGGEMEGVGLFSAAYNAKVDWIILKSIVDWGMSKDDEHQIVAANLSSKLLFEAVKILCNK